MLKGGNLLKKHLMKSFLGELKFVGVVVEAFVHVELHQDFLQLEALEFRLPDIVEKGVLYQLFGRRP